MMKRMVALVPAKSPARSKTRLAGHLSPSQRSDLAQAMLEDVLATLVRVEAIEVLVIGSDTRVQQIAGAFNVKTLPERGTGETAVVEAGTRIAMERGASGTLVIPGDVPLVTKEEVQRVLAAAPHERGAVLVPSRSGRGTNAALRIPADLFPLRFGDDSFVPHRRRARQTGSPCVVLHCDGLGLDVDDPDDLRALLQRPGSGRTHDFLCRSGIAAPLMKHV